MLRCKLWAILAHLYNASIEYFVLHITFLTKKSAIMALKYAKFTQFYGRCWWKMFYLLMCDSFAVKLGSFHEKNLLNWWKIIRNWYNFWWKKICIFLFNSRHVTHIPSFCIVNLLCCGGHFSSITFIDAKTKYRSPYLLDVSQPYL